MAALQMTWQPQQQQQQRRRKAGPPLGLKNLGNTCYLNSVLQCLTYTPPLAQFCLNSQHSSLCKTVFTNREKECPFCLLERQIARSLSLDGPLDAPSKISRGINLFAEHFRWGRQEDAHEFLRYVIDACHNTCLKLLKRLGAAGNGGAAAAGGAPNGNPKLAVEVRSGETGPWTVMKEIFGGALLSQVKCLSCKGESNKTDEIMDISLDLFQSNSLKDALARFFQPEILDGDNKYNCGKCKKASVARKQMFVLRAPNVLVIQLKRFEGIHGGKINRNIEFEEALVLSNFMYNTSQDPQPEYNLFGSIVHSGFSPESGHYYAYIKDASGRWYCCNDAHVSLSCAQEVLSEKVYILFYLRSNQRATSRKTTSPCSMMKSSDSNGTDLLPGSSSVELLKPPIVEPDGVSSKNNISTTLKNGKVSLNPQIIPINLKNREMKGTVANGNGKVAVHNHASVAKNNRSLDCNSSGETKITHEGNGSSAPHSKAVDGNNSSDMMEHGSKQIVLVPNGNGYVNPLKAEVHENNGTQYAVEMERDFDCKHSINNVTKKYHSSVSSFKRKSSDIEKDEDLVLRPEESSKVSGKDDSSKSQSTGYERHPRYELERFKDALAREASSELQTCGWVDKVHNFMLSKKRLCVEAEGSCPDISLLRKQLIIDAKKIFLSQIPESLKEHLIERLRLCNERKSVLDA